MTRNRAAPARADDRPDVSGLQPPEAFAAAVAERNQRTENFR